MNKKNKKILFIAVAIMVIVVVVLLVVLAKAAGTNSAKEKAYYEGYDRADGRGYMTQDGLVIRNLKYHYALLLPQDRFAYAELIKPVLETADQNQDVSPTESERIYIEKKPEVNSEEELDLSLKSWLTINGSISAGITHDLTYVRPAVGEFDTEIKLTKEDGTKCLLWEKDCGDYYKIRFVMDQPYPYLEAHLEKEIYEGNEEYWRDVFLTLEKTTQ